MICERYTKHTMSIQSYSNGITAYNLTPGLHFDIKTNKHGKQKFKLKGKFKKFLKKQGIGYYFLPGNDFPTQIILRGVTEEAKFLLKLSW